MEDALLEQLTEQLKPVVNEPEFDKIFNMLTADMAGPDRFKLKARLRELAAPCNRQIDLRKRVYGDVQAYTFEGRVHYMDAVAIGIFEEGLERYNGVFTVDTYNKIFLADNNIRVIQDKEKQHALRELRKEREGAKVRGAASQLHAPLTAMKHDEAIHIPYFTFGRYVARREERMNYAGAIRVKINGTLYEAVTSDISVSGIRIRLKAEHDVVIPKEFERGTPVEVRFIGFAQEFTIDVNQGVPYVLMASEQRRQGMYLRLKRSYTEDDDDFDVFLSRFIAGYKHRYKVNVDNVYQALLAKANEQLYFPRMSGVPLFFKREEKFMYPKLALETEVNRSVLDNWVDEQNRCVVGGMFSGKRLANFLRQLSQSPKGIVETIVYTFQLLRDGKSYFYSALDSDLKDPELRQQFLGYASRRAQFKVYRFSFAPLDIGKAWIPTTVPADVLKSMGSGVRPPSPEIMKQLEGLTHVGLLTDITPPVEFYQHFEYDKEKLPKLNKFVHPRRLQAPLLRAAFDFKDIRRESRFNHRTQMRIEAHDSGQLGITRDFSVSGLQVQVEQAMDIKRGDKVFISLPELGKRFTSFDLKKMPYQVMHVSAENTVFHLQRLGDFEHVGQQFFSHLISANKKALKVHEQTGTVHGLQLCLRNLYCNSLMTLPLFLKQEANGGLSLHRAGVSSLNEKLKKICLAVSEKGKLNIEPVVSDVILERTIVAAWQRLEPTSRPWTATLMIQRTIENNSIRSRRKWLLPSAYEPEEAGNVKAFLQQGLEAGEVLALQFSLIRTGRPDTEFIADEFRYIQQYASHRAEEVQDEMWSIGGLLDVTVVTNEVLMRFNLINRE
ncbi:hypothetical protein CWE15_07700 [Aliidiomarina taiwanensis]|uniref:PilZ domain-containing protein n=2 Tax=Aliidiomarina taiwanensis TaxID=946228 RepID=A0A432X1Z1_9GAMM|nr:hypothetical protein CWE15_07700 [Aliidiomarina taiwanensis]